MGHRLGAGARGLRALAAASVVALASCGGAEPAPAKPAKQEVAAPGAGKPSEVDTARERLRSSGDFEADLTFEKVGGERLGTIALRSEARGPSLAVTLRRADTPPTHCVLTTRSMTTWSEGDAAATRLVFDLDDLTATLHVVSGQVDRAVGRAPTYSTLEALRAALRPMIKVRVARAPGPRPGVDFGLGLAARDDGASWIEDARRGERAPDGSYVLADDHLKLELDPRTGFFASQEVTQESGDRFVLRCDSFRAAAPAHAPPAPPRIEEQALPVELLSGFVGSLFAPLLDELVGASALTPEKLAEACRAIALAETEALARHELRALARAFVARTGGDVKAMRADLDATVARFLSETEEPRAELERTLARRVQAIRQRTLDPVRDADRRAQLEPALAGRVDPAEIARASARSDELARDLLEKELAR